MKKKIITYICFFCLLFIISMLVRVMMDEIWEYSFSYKIANGFLPYKDINMIVGPCYSLIFSVPFLFFKNNLLVFEIVHCLFYALVFTFAYKKIGTKSIFLALLIGCSFVVFGYNVFCAMLVLVILMLLDSNLKYKDVFVGIIIGIILMTKHNIGLALLMVYIYDNRKKLLNVLSILISVGPILIYLLVNNIFYDYIDYCYLGMGSFITNLSTDILSLIPFIYFLYHLIKMYKKNKDIAILYIIGFQIICFPIFDMIHTVIGLIPIAYYLFLNADKTMLFALKYFISIGFVVICFIYTSMTCEFHIGKDYLNFQMLEKEKISSIQYYNDYLNKQDGKVYLLLMDASMIRLYRQEIPTLYDEFLKGNLGSDENKHILEMAKDCKNKKCTFIVDAGYFRKKMLLDQYIIELKDYIVKHYRYLEDTPLGDKVYVNY